MKIILAIIAAIVVIGSLVFFLSERAPEGLDKASITDETAQQASSSEPVRTMDTVNLETLEFNFTGYGPGKSHLGTFEEISITDAAVYENGSGKAVVKLKTASVDTNIDMLNTHLCTDDFFDCETYPEIIYTVHSITPAEGENRYTVSGTLSFRGSDRTVSFPVNLIEGKYVADFTIETKPFNFKYNGIDNEVRIQMSVDQAEIEQYKN